MNRKVLEYRNKLSSIKYKLSKNKIRRIEEIKKVGGAAMLYTLLVRKNIIYKNSEDLWSWNNKVPVTTTLASTIYSEVSKINVEYRRKVALNNDKNVKATIKHIKEVSNKKRNYKSRSKKLDKTAYEFTFLWGLIRYRRLS